MCQNRGPQKYDAAPFAFPLNSPLNGYRAATPKKRPRPSSHQVSRTPLKDCLGMKSSSARGVAMRKLASGHLEGMLKNLTTPAGLCTSQSKPDIQMVYPEACKELRRRISATISGWDCPLLTFIYKYPGFEHVTQLSFPLRKVGISFETGGGQPKSPHLQGQQKRNGLGVQPSYLDHDYGCLSGVGVIALTTSQARTGRASSIY